MTSIPHEGTQGYPEERLGQVLIREWGKSFEKKGAFLFFSENGCGIKTENRNAPLSL